MDEANQLLQLPIPAIAIAMPMAPAPPNAAMPALAAPAPPLRALAPPRTAPVKVPPLSFMDH